jgi:hypothetical protein
MLQEFDLYINKCPIVRIGHFLIRSYPVLILRTIIFCYKKPQSDGDGDFGSLDSFIFGKLQKNR